MRTSVPPFPTPQSRARRRLSLGQRLARVTGARESLDWFSPLCILFLGIAGILFIHSAQIHHGGGLWIRQIFWLVVGMGVYVGTSMIPYRIVFDKAHWIYLGSILLLLILLFTPLGVERFNSRRWLDLHFFSFQPSETAKLGTLIMVASMLARNELGTVRQSFWLLVKVAAVVGVPILLIFLQPDLGSALVFPPMIFTLLYLSNLSKRFFLAAFLGFVALILIVGMDLRGMVNYMNEHNLTFAEAKGQYEDQAWLPLKDYQRERLLSFLAPDVVDPRGINSSWNLRQSLITVATGGLYGKGIGLGTQAKLGYLPSSIAHNDFIFSTLAEETGFIGGITVIGLYGLLLMNTLRIAGQAGDRFGLLLAAGVAVIFMVHVFVNIGMTIGLTPITGLPLPFLSYGGSFLLSCCLMLGLVQSVHRHRRDFS